MSDYPIEQLSGSDYNGLIALWREAGLPSRPAGRDSREALRVQMGLSFCRFYGVRDGKGVLSGAVIANHEGRKGWINRLAVRPGARRTGIARALVRACEEWLRAEGIVLVAALVEGDNTDSQALFTACGYARDDSLVYFRKAAAPDV